MDLSSLTDLALSALVAAQSGATAAITDVATKLGKAGVEKVCALVKDRFAKDGEGATKALATLENNPTDAVAQKAVRRRLEGLLDEDRDFAADIKAVIGTVSIDKSQHQTATAGDNSTVIQIQGSGKTVG
ncbi:hypothetical protein [Solidesulfovibrio magneticus]|uniref:Uncharacterized protein n=1 Tax=Solidesulfovibrio magneticus (strain ATCC 700980 / DSM 13731 / RS-1) TaxID=573370 RepID=C4XNE5_SOLM1|nr:hypothetical protein [Solidesulfovibrio magneticus]BAH74920.1 hypothetical protein DMR_14290 [Solidesulfovibrio magneticus RS-1]